MKKFKVIVLVLAVLFGSLLVAGSPGGIQPPVKLTHKDHININLLKSAVKPFPVDIRASLDGLIDIWYREELAQTGNSDSAILHTSRKLYEVVTDFSYPKDTIITISGRR